MGEPHGDVTRLLLEWGAGDDGALNELTPIVYDELRRLARSYIRRERPGHTLQGTALVHEAYLRLVDQRQVSWQGRAHFYGVAATAMRRVLVDHARGLCRAKRGGGAVKLPIQEADAQSLPPEVDLLALSGALDELAEMDARKSQVVDMKFFTGLSIEEIAQVLKLSPVTVKREWAFARAWLFRRLSGKEGSRSESGRV